MFPHTTIDGLIHIVESIDHKNNIITACNLLTKGKIYFLKAQTIDICHVCSNITEEIRKIRCTAIVQEGSK